MWYKLAGMVWAVGVVVAVGGSVAGLVTGAAGWYVVAAMGLGLVVVGLPTK